MGTAPPIYWGPCNMAHICPWVQLTPLNDRDQFFESQKTQALKNLNTCETIRCMIDGSGPYVKLLQEHLLPMI